MRRPIPEIIEDLKELAKIIMPEPGRNFDWKDANYSTRLTELTTELETSMSGFADGAIQLLQGTYDSRTDET